MGVAMPGTKKTTVPAKKASKKVARNVTIKKAKRMRTGETPTAVAKTVKTPAKRKTSSIPMNIDFTPGTDMYTAWEEVRRGGASRAEVSKRLSDKWAETKTRNGNDKPVSTILNHVMRRALANGYEIQQTWRIAPVGDTSPAKLDEPVADTPAKKVVKKTTKKTTGTTPVKATKKVAKTVKKR